MFFEAKRQRPAGFSQVSLLLVFLAASDESLLCFNEAKKKTV